jgi:hypothetical protein
VSAGLEEARSLARRALELLLSKYTGAMGGEERKQALKGLGDRVARLELEVSPR